MTQARIAGVTLLFAGSLISQRAPAPDYSATVDVSGKWVMSAQVPARGGGTRLSTAELVLKANGNKITGEVPAGTILPVLPALPIDGWIEGDTLTLMSNFDYEGGEHLRWKLVCKDGHLTGTRQSLHDAPHKYRLDAQIDVDFIRATSEQR